MKTKKIPMRSCVVTREKLPKYELLRVVRTPEGNVIIDETGKANGHGAYLKRDLEIIEKAIKHKILERHLECDIPDQIYDEMKQMIK
ncbi:MAG: YlxR family protein [Bacilli bacterium]|nr:YlxR family protein [Bacilli bacterium]MDD4608141.1 YlxR family protein [Bacilli bacterium]